MPMQERHALPESRAKFENDIDPEDKVEPQIRSEAAHALPKDAQWPSESSMLNRSSLGQSMISGFDESRYQCYNQYISVEVSEPMWSNEGV